jgi:hypothetical protein
MSGTARGRSRGVSVAAARTAQKPSASTRGRGRQSQAAAAITTSMDSAPTAATATVQPSYTTGQDPVLGMSLRTAAQRRPPAAIRQRASLH